MRASCGACVGGQCGEVRVVVVRVVVWVVSGGEFGVVVVRVVVVIVVVVRIVIECGDGACGCGSYRG
jgi:hypothetical protein